MLPTALGRAIQEGQRDVGGTRPDIEQGDLAAMRREGRDRRLAQPNATEPAIDPPQVAQVADQDGRVVERAVEELDGIGETVHRSGRSSGSGGTG